MPVFLICTSAENSRCIRLPPGRRKSHDEEKGNNLSGDTPSLQRKQSLLFISHRCSPKLVAGLCNKALNPAKHQ